MTLLSTAAQNASLANDYGPTRGANAPDDLEVALYSGDPASDGVELDATGGYARPVVPNDGTTWPDAPSGGQIVSALIDFGTSTAAWSDTATHWAIIDNADSTTVWDTGRLGEEIAVTAAGRPVGIVLRPFYATGV